MNPSAPFIKRPVATTLLTIGIALAGFFAYLQLPVAPLPQVDFPTISVFATMPGASPDTMAATVATPLERHLGVIADVTEMTSQSTVGTTRITLQFGLNRNIDGAARDVQAAINAARADLPTSLRQNPTYRKVNPADAPVAILAMTSDTLTRGQIYDAASTVMQQALSQIDGIGQVVIWGSSLPAVRVELNPLALFKYGIGLEDVRAALASANAHSPKGAIEDGDRRYQIYTNDQANRAADYRPLVIAYRDGAPVRLTDVAEIRDSVENLRNQGLSNGKPAVLVSLYRQPGANIIETVDRVKAILPQLEASIPSAINVELTMDRTTTIRTSLHDVERTLLIAIGLVILVVFLFLRNLRATLIPSVAVPVSLIGTFGAMYLLGYSLDNLSLMALTISTGFVVDDAIVVLENVTRHIEAGMPRMQAALQGAREVGFTVLSMSVSLIAVFVPILLMGGIIGRLFREFAMTLSVAIMISLVISLTTTPMMCAYLLPDRRGGGHGRLYRAGERVFDGMLALYDRTLRRALQWPALVMLSLAATLGFAVYLFVIVPKGFIPQQDNGLMIGGIQADQSISFQSMQQKLTQFVDIIQQDPAVASVNGFTGGGQTNSGFVFIVLKPLSERKIAAPQIMARLRPKLNQVAGARLFLRPATDIRVGGRANNAEYQYTLQADATEEIYEWAAKVGDCAAAAAAAHRRQPRPAAERARDRPGHRPRHRGPARADDEPDRQHIVRRLRAAPGVDDLCRAQPIPCRHGGGPGVLAEPGDPEPDLRQHQRRRGQRHPGDATPGRDRGGKAEARQQQRRGNGRRPNRRQFCPQCGEQCARHQRPQRHLDRRCGQHGAREDGAAFRCCPFRPGQHPACGQPPEPVRRLDDLVQSGARRLAQRSDGSHQ